MTRKFTVRAFFACASAALIGEYAYLAAATQPLYYQVEIARPSFDFLSFADSKTLGRPPAKPRDLEVTFEKAEIDVSATKNRVEGNVFIIENFEGKAAFEDLVVRLHASREVGVLGWQFRLGVDPEIFRSAKPEFRVAMKGGPLVLRFPEHMRFAVSYRNGTYEVTPEDLDELVQALEREIDYWLDIDRFLQHFVLEPSGLEGVTGHALDILIKNYPSAVLNLVAKELKEEVQSVVIKKFFQEKLMKFLPERLLIDGERVLVDLSIGKDAPHVWKFVLVEAVHAKSMMEVAPRLFDHSDLKATNKLRFIATDRAIERTLEGVTRLFQNRLEQDENGQIRGLRLNLDDQELEAVLDYLHLEALSDEQKENLRALVLLDRVSTRPSLILSEEVLELTAHLSLRSGLETIRELPVTFTYNFSQDPKSQVVKLSAISARNDEKEWDDMALEMLPRLSSNFLTLMAGSLLSLALDERAMLQRKADSKRALPVFAPRNWKDFNVLWGEAGLALNFKLSDQ